VFIQDVTVHVFMNLRSVHLGPFAAPTAMSDLVVLAGANGGGKSSVLETRQLRFF
jgi:predicted ATPase